MSQGQGKPTERVTRSNRTSVVDKDLQAAVSESLASPIIKQQQQRLEIVVEAAGIRFRGETPADGNCFFHAIVDQAQRLGLKLDGDHVKLRQDVCSFLKDHPSDDNGEPYANFISEAWNDYLKKMSSPGIFVDELIVRKTAKFLNVTLTIFTSSEDSVDSDAAPIIIPGEGPPMILGHYHEYHYQSLEPKPSRKTISCKYHRKGTKETVVSSRKQQAEVCGFCHRENVEDVCGELRVERTTKDVTVAAHQKCMEYSSFLTRYKFTSFGGFYISQVLQEQKRGNLLKCSICSLKKKKKKGSFWGATAGCAIKSCRKSFHYYCACRSDRATTKRLEVNLKSKGEKTILYRVFCSKEHEQQFIKDKEWLEEYKAFRDEDGETDDTNDEDEDGEKEEEEDYDSDDDDSDDPDYIDDAVEDNNEDDVVEEKDKNEDDIDESTKKEGKIDDDSEDDEAKGDDDDDVCVDTEASSDSDLDSIRQEDCEAREDDYDDFDGGNNDTNEAENDESKEDEENVYDEDEDDSNYKDEEDVDESDDNSTDGDSKNTSRIQKNARYDDNTNKRCNKSNSKKRKQSSPNPTDKTIASKKARTSQINGQSNDKSFPAINAESNSDSESDSLYNELKKTVKETGKKKHEKAKKNNQSVDTVALCIVGKTWCSPNLTKKLELAVLKTFKVKSQRFFIWQDLENTPELSKQNIICFIKELVQHCVNGQVDEVEKLLFDQCYLEKKKRKDYRLQGKILQDGSISKQIWTSIKSQLTDSKLGSIIMVEGTSNLVLLLDDFGIDQKGRLRKRLGVQEEVKEEMFMWTAATVVNNTIKENNVDKCTPETEMILKWLKKTAVSPGVYVYPKEEALKAKSENPSAAKNIGSILKTTRSRQKKTSTILVFNQIEKEVVRFVPYWRRVFQSHLSQFSKSDQSLVLFDIRSLSSGVENKLRDVFIDEGGTRIAVNLSSAFDPSSAPISCVLAQLTLTDSQVQRYKVKRSKYTTKSAAKSSVNITKSTAKSSVNITDNKTPSTSTTPHKKLK